MAFLPEDYKAPESSSGRYMKFADGANKFRALSAPVFGFEYWVVKEDGKRTPKRVKTLEEIPNEIRFSSDRDVKPRHFWAFLVWNYNESKAQILSLTQATIKKALEGLDKDADWGDIREYDVLINKTGKGQDTEYSTISKPKTVFDREGKEVPTVSLEALFTGEDPFNSVAVDKKELNDALNDGDLDSLLSSKS